MKTAFERKMKSNRATDAAYVVLLFLMAVVFTEFFHRQTIRYNGAYISDTIVYAQNLGNVEKSRMIAWVFEKLNSIDSSYYAISVFMSLMVVATVVAGYYFVSFFVKRENVLVERYVMQLSSLCVLFSGPIYIPVFHPLFYINTWPKYAWHSPTEIAMVLFALLSVVIFISIYDSYFESIKIIQWFELALTVFLSAWAKPNFMITFAPVVLFVILSDLIRRKGYGLFYRLKRVVMLGSTMIPGGVFVLVLKHLEFSGENSSGGIAISIGYFLNKMDYPLISIMCSLAFPAAVFAVNYRKIRDISCKIILGTFFVGTAEYLIFVETGVRINHCNFGWSRQVGEFILFGYAVALLIINFKDSEFLSDKPTLRKAYFLIAGFLLAAHVLSQLVYVQYLIRGHLYRI